MPAKKIMLTDAIVTGKGDLIFYPEVQANGVAKIYLQTDGNYVLGLEDMDYKTSIDLHVYLSKTAEFTSASVKFFSSQNFSENVYYMIASGVPVEMYKYIIVQKDAAMGPVAIAKLQ
ncbi:MAG TPA: hypothetical protein VKI61_02120 [Chitinophagaceae bacterium]|jgi:hypothetical protein|nr:hypothetical protein [Chitinophagaceae bacterium]